MRSSNLRVFCPRVGMGYNWHVTVAALNTTNAVRAISSVYVAYLCVISCCEDALNASCILCAEGYLLLHF